MSSISSQCGTCKIAMPTMEQMRQHYGSQFHLTNVRRRVEGLRPYSIEEFRSANNNLHGSKQQRDLIDNRYKGTNEGEGNEDHANTFASGNYGNVDAGAVEHAMYSCTLCKKTFRSVQTLQTHIRSTAHLIRKEQRILARDGDANTILTSTSLGSAAIGLHRRHNAKMKKSHVALNHTDKTSSSNNNNKQSNGSSGEETTEGKEVTAVLWQDREEDVSDVRCLFCGFLSASMDSNLTHMERKHNFVIPMRHHCTDVHGLINYLARKVNGLMCIVCNERTRHLTSLQAVRDHMHECDHEKIVLNSEYNEFYDYVLDDPEGTSEVKLSNVTSAGELVITRQPQPQPQPQPQLHRTSQDNVVNVSSSYNPLALLKTNRNGNTTNNKTAGNKDNIDAEIGTKKVVLRREANVPAPRRRETTTQITSRHAILAAESEALAVARREQRELIAQQNYTNAQVAKRHGDQLHTQQLKVSLRNNHLHPKGYDGNIMFD